MVEHIGLRPDHPLHRIEVPHEIRNENLDRGQRHARADGHDGPGHVARRPVGQVVAVHHGDDDVAQPQGGGRLGDVEGLFGIEGAGNPLLDRAIPARPRADAAPDHERGRLAGEALKEVGTPRLFAHGVEALLAHEGLHAVGLAGAREPLDEPGGKPP